MTVLITGGSRGIGRSCAKLFAAKGYDVIVNYNTSEKDAISLQQEIKRDYGHMITLVKADIRDSKSVSEMFEKTGPVDVLVNNSAIAQQKLFTDITDSEWHNMVDTNLSGAFYCCREAAKGMVNKKAGAIINISSMWGICGASCEVHYSAAKAGIIGLTKSLARELGLSGIRVNCVAPGFINTKMNENISEQTVQEIVDSTPLARVGQPEDVAKAVFFLASEDSSFITGQVLTVDGGFLMK